MGEVSVTVGVGAPPATVWDALTDWARQGEWLFATQVYLVPPAAPPPAGQALAAPPPGVGAPRATGSGVGTRFDGLTRLGPVQLRDPMEVTFWDPPRRCEVRHLGPVVRGVGSFEVEPAPAGSRVRWTEWLDPPFGLPGQVCLLALRPLLVVGMLASLERFAARAAAGVATPAAAGMPAAAEAPATAP